MDVKIAQSWKNILKDEFTKEYFYKLTEFVRSEYKTKVIYPQAKNIFNAFDHCAFEDVKVVILGQDPYHGAGQAMGLSFSVPEGVSIPPSLQNVYKELHDDIASFGRPDWLAHEKITDRAGDLSDWAKQGVLLLNATLTVAHSKPGSHQGIGWEEFTDSVIGAINSHRKGIVYVLWGAYAQKKGSFIDREKNFVIESPHPSPFSAYKGFFGSRPFSKTNAYLESHSTPAIVW